MLLRFSSAFDPRVQDGENERECPLNEEQTNDSNLLSSASKAALLLTQ